MVKVNSVWDYSRNTVANAKRKTTATRRLSDMTNDASWNTVEKYSDWSTRTLDKKWNVLSDTAVKNSGVNANPIQNASKSSDQRDYMADVSKDKNRAIEMIGNIKQYAQENPQLFKNYDNFKKYFNYDARSASQQKVLDAAYKNYNKYWLNSTENKVADDASQVAADKGNEKIQIAADWYKKKAANLQRIYDTMNPKYQNLIDKYDKLYQKAFDELDELKKLANEYYEHTKGMYDEQSAGEAAWVESRLSAQWLGYTAIWSATTWIGNQWAKRYNNLMETHLNTLMNLQDKWATIKTTILNWMWDLTDKQKWLVSDYLTWLNNLWDAVEQEQQNAVDWIYAPYEAITWQKVAGTAEKAKTQSEKDAVESNYSAANTNSKVKILIDNLWVDDSIKLTWNYEAILEEIAKQYPNDINKALSVAKARFGKTSSSSTKNTVSTVENEVEEEWWNDDWVIVQR